MNGFVLPLHVAAGGLALLFGALALSVKKGGTVHRRVGQLFAGAMFVMAASAAILGNPFGGLMTIYFVGTALVTVRPESPRARRIHFVAMTFAAGLALFDVAAGVEAFGSPRGARNGVPFPMFFFLAAVMSLAALGDLRIVRSGTPRGGRRLARHLWRMSFALFIAAGSFFSIRERVAKILPEPFTSGTMRALPIVLLFGAMLWWLWRVRGRRALPAIVRHEPLPR